MMANETKLRWIKGHPVLCKSSLDDRLPRDRVGSAWRTSCGVGSQGGNGCAGGWHTLLGIFSR